MVLGASPLEDRGGADEAPQAADGQRMSAAGPSQGANGARSGSAAAIAASVGVLH